MLRGVDGGERQLSTSFNLS